MKEKKYRYISFLIPKELEQSLKEVSVEHDRSMAWIIRTALEAFLKNKPDLSKRSSDR